MLIQERLTSGSLPSLLSCCFSTWPWPWPHPNPRPQALGEEFKGTETCGHAIIGKGTPLKSSKVHVDHDGDTTVYTLTFL